MNKSEISEKKRLKARRRANKIKKQNNYEFKTHKGTGSSNLKENLKRNLKKDEEEKHIWQTLKEKMGM